MNVYSNPSAFWESRLTEYFDLTGVGHTGLGPSYNRRMYMVRLRTLERALRAAGCRLNAQRVLEIGCGTGFYTEFFRQRQVASYTGVDITAVSVQTLARRYPDFCFLQADVGDRVFPVNDGFDVIVVADVLFHIVDDSRFQRAITNLSDRLQPGGYLILSDILSAHTVQPAPHFRSRSLAVYEELLAQNQLTVRHIEPIFAVMQPPVSMHGIPWRWQTYALIWRYGLMRMARWGWFDRTVPAVLEDLDERFFLRRAGVGTPNSKWLMAVKADVV
jgi:SAM-dependent methyltransferase